MIDDRARINEINLEVSKHLNRQRILLVLIHNQHDQDLKKRTLYQTELDSNQDQFQMMLSELIELYKTIKAANILKQSEPKKDWTESFGYSFFNFKELHLPS